MSFFSSGFTSVIRTVRVQASVSTELYKMAFSYDYKSSKQRTGISLSPLQMFNPAKQQQEIHSSGKFPFLGHSAFVYLFISIKKVIKYFAVYSLFCETKDHSLQVLQGDSKANYELVTVKDTVKFGAMRSQRTENIFVITGVCYIGVLFHYILLQVNLPGTSLYRGCNVLSFTNFNFKLFQQWFIAYNFFLQWLTVSCLLFLVVQFTVACWISLLFFFVCCFIVLFTILFALFTVSCCVCFQGMGTAISG